MEAQLKLRYSQEGFKKAQRGPDWLNRCFGSSKALVPWLCHTLQVKHEAEGGLLRRGLPTGDVFCVQAATVLSCRGLVVGRRREVVFACGTALCCSVIRSSWLRLPGILRILCPIGIGEEK